MSNTLIINKTLAMIQQAYETYQTTTKYLHHNGLKGSFNEYGFVSLIKDFLPKNYSIGKGVIIDTMNSQSCEADVIIYDNTDINPVLFGPDSGFFPIESCRYVIEIKTISTSREIKDVITKASILKSMNSINGQLPVFSYFAFSSDLSSSNEFCRYYNYETKITSNSTIDTICVMKSGYWYKNNTYRNNNLITVSWQGIISNGSFDEVLSFISGILNTLNRKTPLGHYMFDDLLVPFVYQNFLNINFEIKPDKIEIYNEFALYLEKNDYDNEIISLLKLVDNVEMQYKVLKAFSIDDDKNPLRKEAYDRYIAKHF